MKDYLCKSRSIAEKGESRLADGKQPTWRARLPTRQALFNADIDKF